MLQETGRGLSVLMIERAHREGDPWSGHMAFPGGMQEPGDRHSLAVARREALEEVGHDPLRGGDIVGRLSDRVSRSHRGRLPMVVTPFVFSVADSPRLKPNHEVADTLWVPLSFLADPDNRQRMQWRHRGLSLELPCYFYEERRIWGLSLMMLDELLALLREQR